MHQNNSQLYSKKEIKTLLLRLNAYDLTSNFRIYVSSKISSHNSWKTTQLSKMLWNNVPLTVQRIKHNDLLQEFPAAVSSLSLLKAFCRFRKYLKCIQLKRCLKSASHYFYCFDGLKSVTTVMCQRSHCEKTWGGGGGQTPPLYPPAPEGLKTCI